MFAIPVVVFAVVVFFVFVVLCLLCLVFIYFSFLGFRLCGDFAVLFGFLFCSVFSLACFRVLVRCCVRCLRFTFPLGFVFSFGLGCFQLVVGFCFVSCFGPGFALVVSVPWFSLVFCFWCLCLVFCFAVLVDLVLVFALRLCLVGVCVWYFFVGCVLFSFVFSFVLGFTLFFVCLLFCGLWCWFCVWLSLVCRGGFCLCEACCFFLCVVALLFTLLWCYFGFGVRFFGVGLLFVVGFGGFWGDFGVVLGW